MLHFSLSRLLILFFFVFSFLIFVLFPYFFPPFPFDFFFFFLSSFSFIFSSCRSSRISFKVSIHGMASSLKVFFWSDWFFSFPSSSFFLILPQVPTRERSWSTSTQSWITWSWENLNDTLILRTFWTRTQVNSFQELKALYDDTAFYHDKSLNECCPHISFITTGAQPGLHHQRWKWQGPGEPQERALQRPANVNVILEAFRQCQDSVQQPLKSLCKDLSSHWGCSFCSFYSFSFIPFFLFLFFLFFLWFTLQGKFTELQFDDSGVLCGVCEYDSICWRRRGLTAAFVSSSSSRTPACSRPWGFAGRAPWCALLFSLCWPLSTPTQENKRSWWCRCFPWDRGYKSIKTKMPTDSR